MLTVVVVVAVMMMMIVIILSQVSFNPLTSYKQAQHANR
jgi:hypothetical protein